jgi:hypothetical protein
MAKSDEQLAREQRLAAKLRENLKRRKGQQKARGRGTAQDENHPGRTPGNDKPA